MAKSLKPTIVYQLKITLKNIRPPIWRRVQVTDCTLARLDDIFQRCFDWEGYHLHAFEAGGEQYGPPDPDGMLDLVDERRMRLAQLIDGGIRKFLYTYDFGDNWDHTVEVEKTFAPEEGVRYPRCITGKRACPPEDCGGPWGYAELLAILSDPKHPEYEERIEWLGDEFDPEAVDLEAINARLRTLG